MPFLPHPPENHHSSDDEERESQHPGKALNRGAERAVHKVIATSGYSSIR